jgi:hypothetical protein
MAAEDSEGKQPAGLLRIPQRRQEMTDLLQRRNIAVNINDEDLVLSCNAISIDDLTKIGRFIGIPKEEK